MITEVALATGTVSAATPAPAKEPSKASSSSSGPAKAAKYPRGSKGWAIAEAKKTGEKVVATDETTATSYTVANTDGTLTTELTSGPERVWRDGNWHKVDVTLTKDADGTVRSKEHPHGLRLSGKGGTKAKSLKAAQSSPARDLVTLGSGDGSVTLQWKGALPEPDLNGTRARYHDAVPGADVIVEATRTGFEQFVELAEKPAIADFSYTLPLLAEGMKAKANKDGSVTFTDSETGDVRATMPAPVMWDAATDAHSGEHTNRARVDMEVRDRGEGRIDLVVSPDPRFLTDPATQYPVTVDPSTSALANTFDTYVQQGETVDWSADVELDFGNPGTTNPNGTPRTARSFITWNTSAFQDALIIDTNLALWNFHSGNTDCSAQSWTIGDTSGASTSSRWTNQPTWTQYHTSTQTRGNPDCTSAQPDGWINADVDTLVQTWASAKATRGHMGLRAANDSTAAWKRVNSANNASNQPKLSVTYNYRPLDGTAQQAGPPFRSHNDVWGVNTLTPTLRDKFEDADGDLVSGTFQVYDAATNTPISTPAGEGLLVSASVAPGSWATVQVPAGQLVDGKMYKFRTNAYDGTHYNLNWSPWRTFVVETAAAGVPTTLQPGDSYTINDPALIADPAKVEQVLNRDGNLEALGVLPRGGPSSQKSVKTKAAWERTYTVPSTRFPRGRAPEKSGFDKYEYIANVDECVNADDSDNKSGYIKNRFSYCQETLTVMPAVKCGLWPPGCYLQGVFISRNTLIGKGKIGGLLGGTATRYVEFDYNVDVFVSSGDFGKVGAKLKATLECRGSWAAGVPSEAKEEEACEPGTATGRSDSPSQWKVDGDTKFDLWSTAPRVPDVANGDQVATGLFTPVLEFTLPGYSQALPAEGEEGEVRFDSAAYNVRAKLGSVFPDATPALRYDRSDTSDPAAPVEPYRGVAAVADHVGDALENPGSTFPAKAGKSLPGGKAVQPMHRLVKSAGALELSRYEANRRVVSSTCSRATMPGHPGTGLDCDEFPMASTWEGAARAEYEGAQYTDEFSVRYINSDENQEAGSRLGAWYHNDRILNNDAFILVIGD
ncbi:DNRLRE domain-containing protein [Streptomyces parvus]|uniref:DNRLRE domain-containing protein n=1 Tax=Streptomyces parvus TaxID=66428 RepID=UPI00341CFD61